MAKLLADHRLLSGLSKGEKKNNSSSSPAAINNRLRESRGSSLAESTYKMDSVAPATTSAKWRRGASFLAGFSRWAMFLTAVHELPVITEPEAPTGWLPMKCGRPPAMGPAKLF